MGNLRTKRYKGESPGGPHEDPDHDRLTNQQEWRLGTDPNNPDTDGDGIPDGAEVKGSYKGHNFEPTDPRDSDSDNDRIKDGQEVMRGSDPHGKD